MVLSKEYVNRNFKEIQENSYDYLFLNVKSLREQTQTIERAIDVLALINEVNRIKELCNVFKTNVKYNDSILYQAMKCIYDNECFTDEQLQEYIKLKCQLYKVYDVMYSFAEVDCCLCSRTEYFLFGLGFDEQEKLSRVHTFNLEEEFNDAFYNNYKALSSKIICEKSKEVVLKYKNIEVKKST